MNEKNVKSTWDNTKTIKAIFAGGVISFVSVLILNIIMASVLSKVDIFGDVLIAFSMMVFLISSFIGGFSTAKILKKNGLLMGAITSLCFYLTMLLVGVCSNGFVFTKNSLIKLAVIVGGGIMGGIIGVNIKKKRR